MENDDTKAKAPKTGHETRYHRDGDVTVWSVHRQQWVRCPAGDVSDETLATLPMRERERIVRIAERLLRDAIAAAEGER